MARKGRIDYLCLQPTREGQASHAHVLEIVEGLRRRGWDVRLVQPALPSPGRFDAARRLAGVLGLQLRYWLRNRLRPAPYVYVRVHFAALPTAMLARATVATVVQELNGPFEDAFAAWPSLRPLRRLVLAATRVQLRWADGVIVVTEGLAGYVRERTGRRTGVEVVGNGANVDRFHPAAAAKAPAGPPYVAFLGALAPWQGVATILAAAADPSWPAGVELRIAGDGQERERVQAAAAANPRVRWLGTVPYADAPVLLAESLAALVPMSATTQSEHGLSKLKLFEALASGVPVVASDLVGLAEVVREGDCGIVVPPDDAAAVARAVAALAADPRGARAMGVAGRALAVERYSWDARAAETEAALLRTAARRQARRRARGPARSASSSAYSSSWRRRRSGRS